MKKTIYYTTTALIVSCGIVKAQTCVPTPTCSTLGYTSTTACDGGIKCPFGEAWNCSTNEIKTEIIEKITELTNKITEQTNKITEIEQKIVEQEQESSLKSCQIGHLFNSDKTCSVTAQSGKTPIGVVVYVDGFGHGQVMSLKSIGSYTWGGYGTDISSLPNYSSAAAAFLDLDSCGNTAKIVAAGNKSKYPAAWAAHEYKTEGTNAGDWCLPAAGIISSIYYHQQEVNMGLVYGNGTQFTTSTTAWSSSEYDSRYAWYSYFGTSYGLGTTTYGKSLSFEVRPVLAF